MRISEDGWPWHNAAFASRFKQAHPLNRNQPACVMTRITKRGVDGGSQQASLLRARGPFAWNSIET